MGTEYLSNSESFDINGETNLLKKEALSSVDNRITTVCNALPSDIKITARKILSKDKSFTLRAFTVYDSLRWNEKPAFFPFFCAYKWYNYLWGCWGDFKYSKKRQETYERVGGKLNNYLAVVDYSKFYWKRFYLIEMGWGISSATVVHTCTCVQWQWYSHITGEVWNDTIASKKNPGKLRVQAQPWENSNTENSYLSSPWFFYIPWWIYSSTSVGRHLKVEWIEPWLNDEAHNRYIYVHVWSVSEGCFVIPMASKEVVLWKLKEWWMIFSYFADNDYLSSSDLLNH